MGVKIYGTNHCPWCKKAVALAEQYKFEYEYIICNTPETKQEFKDNFPDAKTVPQIIWNGKHVGGYEDFASEIENTREFGQGGF